MFKFEKLSEQNSKYIYKFSTGLGEKGILEIENNNITITYMKELFGKEISEKSKSKTLHVAQVLIKENFPDNYTYAFC